MRILDARRMAIRNAAEWVFGAGTDQFWGEDLANEARADIELANTLSRAQRQIASRIKRLATRAQTRAGPE